MRRPRHSDPRERIWQRTACRAKNLPTNWWSLRVHWAQWCPWLWWDVRPGLAPEEHT